MFNLSDHKFCDHSGCDFSGVLEIGSEWYCVLHCDDAAEAHKRFVAVVKDICRTVREMELDSDD